MTNSYFLLCNDNANVCDKTDFTLSRISGNYQQILRYSDLTESEPKGIVHSKYTH
jgi:hypothetical protein